MKNYARDNKPLVLLKKAIDIFADGEVFHGHMALVCQSIQLQGHKRWNRAQATEDRNRRIEVQNYVVDMFGDILEPSWEYETPKILSVKEYLEAYLDWEISVYERIATISNELTVLGYIEESKLISSCLCDVRKEIEKVRRWNGQFELIGYDMSYILLVDKVLHDKVKEIEEK